jgi:anti-sigma B factor antagonist
LEVGVLDQFGPADWILMLVAPPLAGCAIGLLMTRARRQPGLAAIGAAVSGTAGAWLGVALYRWAVDAIIGGRDRGILVAIVLGGSLLGAMPLSWILSGPRRLVTRPADRTGCGLAIAGGGVSAVGVFLYMLASERSAFIPIDESVKYLGLTGILGGMLTLVIALWRAESNARRRPEYQGMDIENVGDVTVVHFKDKSILEEQNIQFIAEQLLDLVGARGARKIMLDFRSVEYLSSAFLGRLVELHSKVHAAGGRLVLCNVAPQIQEFFEITKVNKLLDIKRDDDPDADLGATRYPGTRTPGYWRSPRWGWPWLNRPNRRALRRK